MHIAHDTRCRKAQKLKNRKILQTEAQGRINRFTILVFSEAVRLFSTRNKQRLRN